MRRLRLTPIKVLCCVLVLAAAGFGQTPNPVPFVNQPLVPTAVAPGGPGFTLTVNGTGFVPGAKVSWNGTPRTTTFVSASQLTAAILDTDIGAPRTASVTVVNPAPGGGISNVASLQVALPASFVPLSRSDFDSGLISLADASGGDFNGDGNLDIALVDHNANVVSILLGIGDGTFQPRADYATGVGPQTVAAADLNGDGQLDLVVPNSSSNTVSIFIGNGDGSFQPQIAYAAPAGARAVTIGDFNSDGKLDLAVVSLVGLVSLYLGNGDGSFGTQVDSPADQSLFVMAADFNGDQKLDLALAPDISLTISVLLGNGDGSFQPRVEYATGPSPFDGVVADFNGDGKLDLALADYGGGTVSLLLGNGDGSFQTHADLPVGPSPVSITTGDFNADGQVDLAVVNLDRSSVSLLLGNGDGTFKAHVDYMTPPGPYPLVAGDFNGDGRLDLAVGTDGHFVTVLLQNLAVQLSPASLAFETVAVGESSGSPPATLTNNTPSAVTISSIDAHGDFAVAHNCPISPSTLASGANCTIEVTFTPTADGPRDGDVTISDDGPGNPHVITLSGTGLGPNASLAPAAVDFPAQYVGTSGLPQTITLTNTGSASLTITKVETSSDEFGALNACTTSVAPGVGCAIGVFFRPTASGTRTGELIITDDAPGSPHIVMLSGVGTDFQIVISSGSSTSQTITAGQTASYVLAIDPVSGFTGSLALTCSGAPSLGTCSVSPTSITLDGINPAMVTVTVTTTAPSLAGPRGGDYRSPLQMFNLGARHGVPLILGLLMLLLISVMAASSRLSQAAGHRPALQRALLGAALLSILLWAACGGGGSPQPRGGTPPGTYILTIGGTVTTASGALNRNLTLTLKVN